MVEILDAFQQAYGIKGPVCIVANTVKGKGVSFMENAPEWHCMPISKEQMNIALQELDKEDYPYVG